MNEDEIKEKYTELMEQKNYKEASDLALQHELLLVDVGLKYHKQIVNSKTKGEHEKYEKETNPEWYAQLDTFYSLGA